MDLHDHAGVPNGQPKLLLNLFLPGYPLVNFAICTAVYVFVSHRLFMLTNALKNVAIPGKDMGLLWRNGAIMAVAAVVRHVGQVQGPITDAPHGLIMYKTFLRASSLASRVLSDSLLSWCRCSPAGAVCSGGMCAAIQLTSRHPMMLTLGMKLAQHCREKAEASVVGARSS